MIRNLLVVLAISSLAACGGVDAKSGEGTSGEPTIDITGGGSGGSDDGDQGGSGGGGGVVTPGEDRDDTPPDPTNSMTVEAREFGLSSVATIQFVETVESFGSITQLAISDIDDLCGALPDSCDVPVTAEGEVLALALFSGEELATGGYEIGQFDEENFNANTRVAMGGFGNLDNSGTSTEITNGRIQVEIHDENFVSGSFEVEVGGQILFGTFSTTECAAAERLGGC